MSINYLLYAPTIHQGGGRSLLLPLLEVLQDDGDITFIFDQRLKLPQGLKLAGVVHRVNPTFVSRFAFEWRLRGLISAQTKLLCMGSLPPLLAHQGDQTVFVQNRYLIDSVALDNFPLWERIRLGVERWWLCSRAGYVNRYIVQTPTMQRLLANALGKNAEVLPFVGSMADVGVTDVDAAKRYDFLYVASGEPHKNHMRLIEAWIILAERKIFPSLCLTLDESRFPKLHVWASAQIRRYGLNIALVGECSYSDVQRLYRQSRAMIYPSLLESFGLPLVEAVAMGLPVLTSDASYVTDVICPSGVFDPVSSEAIADAVQHFDYKPASLKVRLLDAREFLCRAFNKGRVK